MTRVEALERVARAALETYQEHEAALKSWCDCELCQTVANCKAALDAVEKEGGEELNPEEHKCSWCGKVH